MTTNDKKSLAQKYFDEGTKAFLLCEGDMAVSKLQEAARVCPDDHNIQWTLGFPLEGVRKVIFAPLVVCS